MNSDFTRALARAMEHVRAQDPAPGHRNPPRRPPGAGPMPAERTDLRRPDSAARPPRRFRIAPDAADAETVADTGAGTVAETSADTVDAAPRRTERPSLREVVDLLQHRPRPPSRISRPRASPPAFRHFQGLIFPAPVFPTFRASPASIFPALRPIFLA